MKEGLLHGRQSEKRRRADKVTAALLIFTMLLSLLSGCGNGAETDSENSNGNEQNVQSAQPSEEDKAMGRYVEESVELWFDVTKAGLYQLADGSLVIANPYFPLYISKDNGVTWEADDSLRDKGLWDNKACVYDMAVGADKTVALICAISEEGQEINIETGEGLHTRFCLIKPDGTEIVTDIAVTKEDEELLQGETNPFDIWFTDTGRIFVSTTASSIYEVWEDGRSELFLKLLPDYHPILIQCQANLMVIDGGNDKAPLIYDMDKEEYIEDEVLGDFVKENYSGRTSDRRAFDMYIFPGEEGVLYLAGNKGLHRHVIGGSIMEQVIDGSLTGFNNPANKVYGMLKLDNNVFCTLFGESGLVRYVYDPDAPAVLDGILKVYSLQENDTIRQVISLYQTTNPGVRVDYEIGMDKDSSVTREDALKKLNTKIMAGEGPDVLFLDNMPLHSYIEKGMLLDMSPILDNLSGEDALFTNITDAMKTEDKIYAMPLEIQMPIIYGEKEDISKADNLESIADVMEELQQENPEQDLLGIYTERGIMYLFSMVSAPTWTTENGEIDMEAITEFLTQAKRIYDAQMAGYSEDMLGKHIDQPLWGQSMWSRGTTDGERTNTDVMNYFLGNTHIVFGTVFTAYGYAQIDSVTRVNHFENSEWCPMNGQSSNVFLAKTLVGINAASESMDAAEAFIRLCLGKDNQTNLFNGYAVNQAAFDEGFVKDGVDQDNYNPNSTCGNVGVPDSDGVVVYMDIYWPNREQISKLKNYVATVDTPYIEDTILEDAVYEAGIDYLQGNTSLEEAINEIEKKVSIIMAE